MIVMRSALISVWLVVSCGLALAQAPGISSPIPDLPYLLNQSPSVRRDSALILIYAQKAELTASSDSALQWLQEGFEIALQLRSSKWLAFSHNRIGRVYLQKGVSFQAMEYLFKGLQYAEIARNTSEQAFSWDYIGDCYANLKKYDKAIIAENHAISLYRQHNDPPKLASSLNDLGSALSANGELPAAIDALEQSLTLSRNLHNPDLLVGTYHILAATLLKEKDFEEARKYAQLAIFTQTEDRGRANAELLALMSLIEASRSKPKESLGYAAKAEFYLSYEWPSTQEQVAFTLFETYKALQNPTTALFWYEKYVSFREKNMQAAQKKSIERVRYEYDARQLDVRLQRMADDMARESYLRWILGSASVIFLLLAIALYRSNVLMKKQGRELDTTNSQLVHIGQLLQQTNASLEDRVAARTNELCEANRTLILKNLEIREALFRGQSLERKRVASELHDNLGSLLSGIKWRLESVEIHTLSPSEQSLHQGLVELITDAYDQVRHISHNLLPAILEKEGLVPALGKLIADVNVPGKLTAELIAAADVFIEDKKVAFELYSCALELITNILKHAQARHVVVEVIQTEGFHILMITDDGVGTFSGPADPLGQGLENVRQRVKSLHGNFFLRPLKSNQRTTGRLRPSRGTVATLRIPRQTALVF